MEAETRVRTEMQRARKKLETDITDYMTQLDAAHRAAAEAHKQSRRAQDQTKELQVSDFAEIWKKFCKFYLKQIF
jgi:hypothetical protein